MSRIIDVSKASKANILKEQGEPVSTEDIAIYTYEEIVNILNENNIRLTAFDIENGVFTYDFFDGETTTTITKDITPFIDSLFARKISPTFTGTVSGITKSMVGLSNVDNTSDLSKPISTLTQTALDGKVDKYRKFETTSTQWQEFNWSFAGTGSDTSLKLINNTRNGVISLKEALVVYQGKVSIGGNGVADNTPTKELEVKGEALINGGLYLNSYQYSADKLLKTVTSAFGVQVVSTDLSVTNDDKLGLGTTTPAGKLDVVSTTMPSYPFPRMTTTQIDALVGMVEGAWVFDITTHHPKYFNGTIWVQI